MDDSSNGKSHHPQIYGNGQASDMKYHSVNKFVLGKKLHGSLGSLYEQGYGAGSSYIRAYLEQ